MHSFSLACPCASSGGPFVLRSLTRPEYNNRNLPNIRRTVTSTSRCYVLLGAAVVSKKCVVFCSGDSRVRIFRILAFMTNSESTKLGDTWRTMRLDARSRPGACRRPSCQTQTKHALVGYCPSLAILQNYTCINLTNNAQSLPNMVDNPPTALRGPTFATVRLSIRFMRPNKRLPFLTHSLFKGLQYTAHVCWVH